MFTLLIPIGIVSKNLHLMVFLLINGAVSECLKGCSIGLRVWPLTAPIMSTLLIQTIIAFKSSNLTEVISTNGASKETKKASLKALVE